MSATMHETLGTRNRSGPLAGHRRTSLGRSPFASTTPAVVMAVVFALGCLVWLAAGDGLPGGRWIVVHMFTLGVVTPLIWAFSRHFAARFTGAGEVGGLLVPSLVLAISVVMMLAGRALHAHVPLAVGTGGIIAVVGVNTLRLAGIRRRNPDARFAWVVSSYGHAHLALLAAATAGAGLGAGWVSGTWFAAVRSAHTHLAILGWAGLTLLATLVVFGPALLRARMEPGADVDAARALPWAAAGLALAVVGFLLEAVHPEAALPGRMFVIVGLSGYTVAVFVVARPLFVACLRYDRSPLRWPLMAAVAWFPALVAVDVLVSGAGLHRWGDVLGLGLLVGVLGQSVLAVLLYLAPMLKGRDFAARDVLLRRVERFARSRTIAFDLGLVVVLGAAVSPRALDVPAPGASRLGWTLVAAGVVAQLLVLVWPLGEQDPASVRSRTAARYRQEG